MRAMEKLLALLSKGKGPEIRELARGRLKKNRGDAEAWFMLGMVAHNEGARESAMEYFERALYYRNSPKYLKAMASLQMEMLDFGDAIETLREALELEDDADANFLMGIACLFLDSPKSRLYIKKAHRIDPKRTKKLLQRFYDKFFRDDVAIPESEKKRILEKLAR